MLIHIKLNEIIRHIDYCLSQYDQLNEKAYPSLEVRMQLSRTTLEEARQELAELADLIANYREPSVAGFDTWRQLYQRLFKIDLTVQFFRLHELPAYLGSSRQDYAFSILITNVCTEIGLSDVQAVVSLYQNSWFSVFAYWPRHPLFLLPASITSDLSEFPLIFHEIGHVLFSLWEQPFVEILTQVVIRAVDRKTQEISGISDRRLRTEAEISLRQLQEERLGQLEELVCDIVGCLLGGTAFGMALTLGLWLSDDPFTQNNSDYPPLDYRIRVVEKTLEYLKIDDACLPLIRSGWEKVRSTYNIPHGFALIYDDQYLDEMIHTVAEQLSFRGLKPFSEDMSGIRGLLHIGAKKLLEGNESYTRWSLSTINALLDQDQNVTQQN